MSPTALLWSTFGFVVMILFCLAWVLTDFEDRINKLEQKAPPIESAPRVPPS